MSPYSWHLPPEFTDDLFLLKTPMPVSAAVLGDGDSGPELLLAHLSHPDETGELIRVGVLYRQADTLRYQSCNDEIPLPGRHGLLDPATGLMDPIVFDVDGDGRQEVIMATISVWPVHVGH